MNCLRVRLVFIGSLALLVLLFPGLTPLDGRQPARSEEDADRVIRIAAEKFCYSCHGTARQRAEVNIEEALDAPGGLSANPSLLQDFLRVVKDGDMPPRSAKAQPSQTERDALIAELNARLVAVQNAQADDPGPVVVARLTRDEYRNVIRDLSGGVVVDAGRLLPNEGGAGEGFANVGEAQGMSAVQFEKYFEAAKSALNHLRVDPVNGMVWRPVPRDPVHEPGQQRKEAVDDIIAWYVAEQVRLATEHRQELKNRLGFEHAAYLEAAWQYHWRTKLGRADATLDDIARDYEVPLAPVPLKKWYAILNQEPPEPAYTAWAKAWKGLPEPDAELDFKQIREACRAIELGQASKEERLEYAPEYERNWHDPKRQQQTLADATEGHWPFDINIGDAKELYLVMTDAGDGSNREYGIWHSGRLHYEDGSVKPWQEAVRVVGASSGRDYAWGKSAEGQKLSADSIGVKPPGALKFAVPAGAIRLEVTLSVDRQRHPDATVQAIILKQPPKRGETSFYPARPIFGGKKVLLSRTLTDRQKANDPLKRHLNRRNLAQALRTKIGLNAERNVLADWSHCDVRYIGGPWPDHEADRNDPGAPYHLTAEQARENATPESLAELQRRLNRLEALVQRPHQQLQLLLDKKKVVPAREGVVPDQKIAATWPQDEREQLEKLRMEIETVEHQHEVTANDIVSQFATRAWRRPISVREQQQLVHLYQEARSRGDSFDSAIKSALLVVLASPHFIYRLPLDDGNDTSSDVRPLSSLELASRLSFFLWASIPDEKLLQLASENRLRDPEVLADQVTRMLNDPRSLTLSETFAAQTFRFADFPTFTGPDEKRFPEFQPALRQAMYDEAIWFFDDLFRNDRPLTRIIRSEDTFANGRLAKHYGISGVTGDNPQRVKLPEGRGGLIGMGLFLTQSSLPLRTSPVQRGNWVLEDLLGRRLPDPPADIPPLSDDDTNEQNETIVQQLAKHRANPTCASCHDKIDPLGIALEDFDPIGRWRGKERTGADDMTRTHDGVELNGVEGLRDYLELKQDELFGHFNRKLLGYALGRAVIPGDARLLDRMGKKLKENDYRSSAAIMEIVQSRQFQHTRVQN